MKNAEVIEAIIGVIILTAAIAFGIGLYYNR